MGTDIHMIAEVRNPQTKQWKVNNKPVFKDPWSKEDTIIPYQSRNYDTFAILADVRNGSGFAGCCTGDRFIPISEPRGLPSDMDPEVKDFLSGCHSESYITLQELLSYPHWDKLRTAFGVVDEENYKLIKSGEKPNSWCGGVGGGKIVQLKPSEMDDLIAGKMQRDPDKEYYTACHLFAESYAEASGLFYSNAIPALKKLIPEGGSAEDVRIVFDFDS